MSKPKSRLDELGKGYVPRPEKGQSAEDFIKEEIVGGGGITKSEFLSSAYFKEGGFASQGKPEEAISVKLGGPTAKDSTWHAGTKTPGLEAMDGSGGDTGNANSSDGAGEGSELHAATGDAYDKKDPLGVAEDSEHDEGNVLKKLKAAEDRGDTDEVARLTTVLQNLQHGEGKGLADLADAGAGSLSAADKAKEAEEEKEKKKKEEEEAKASFNAADGKGEGYEDDPPETPKVAQPKDVPNGEKMVFRQSVAPAMKVKTEPLGNRLRFFGDDVGDISPLAFPTAKKPRHHAWNFFVRLFVEAIESVRPVKTIELNAEGGYGVPGLSECKRVISDPSEDCWDLLQTGAAGADGAEVAQYYARLNGIDVAQIRADLRLRVDMNFTGLRTGSSILGNQGAVMSGDMYTDQGTVIMSEERATRLNVGMFQYRQNMADPGELLKMFGKSSGAFKLKSSAEAIFTETECKFFGQEKPGFDLIEDLSFCILRGWGTPAIALPNFSLNAIICRDEEKGAAMRAQSMAEAAEAIGAFNPSTEPPINTAISRKVNQDLLVAAGQLTPLAAARWATQQAQYLAGGVYMQQEIEVDLTAYTKQIAPYACFATMVMSYFPSYTLASQILLVDSVLRPFVGNVTPAIRAHVMGNVPNVGGFVNDSMAQINATRNPPIMVGMAVGLMRNVLRQIYALVRRAANPVLDGGGGDGRFWRYQQDRAPKRQNGTPPAPNTPLNDLYGTRFVQKGFPVNGDYWVRDMHAITWNNLQQYQSDINVYSGYSVMVNESSFAATFAPYSRLFMEYLSLVSRVLAPNERGSLQIFQNIGSDCLTGKGGGLMNMSLSVMHAMNQDAVLPAGPGYQGIVQHIVNPEGDLQNFGTMPVDFHGALAFMHVGIEPVETSAYNRFNTLERLSIGDVGVLQEKNRQMAIMIANDVMAASCNPSMIEFLTDELLQVQFAPGGGNGNYNEFYLQNYTDEVVDVVKHVCQKFYKAGSAVEKFAVEWVLDREKNRRVGSPFRELYFDNPRFHVQGYTRISLLNMRNANDQEIAGPVPVIGLGYRMPSQEPVAGHDLRNDHRGLCPAFITRKQVPYTTRAIGRGDVNAALGEIAPAVTSAQQTVAADFCIAQGPLDFRPTDERGPRTVMGMHYNRCNRYFLFSKDACLPHENYGLRIWNTSSCKVALTKDQMEGSFAPFFTEEDPRTQALPLALTAAGGLAAAPQVLSVVSKTDYQRYCSGDNEVLFNALDYAEWETNVNILTTVGQPALLEYCSGGMNLHRLPTPQALIDEGLQPQLVQFLTGYENAAYILSDLRTLVNNVFVGEGSANLRLRPTNNSPGFSNLYGNGLLKYALYQMSNRAAFQPAAGQATALLAAGRLGNAYGIASGNAAIADRDLIRCGNFYSSNPALVATIMTAVVRGCSYKERQMIAFKTDVEVEHQEVSDTTSFEAIEMPEVKITETEFYSGKLRADGQRDMDAPRYPREALKLVTDSKLTIGYTNTERAHPVNIRSHTTSMNPNVNKDGAYINPFYRSRREQAIIGVVGCGMDDFVEEGRVNVIKDLTANARTSGRGGANVILAPASFPIPSASIEQDDGLETVGEYHNGSPVRCFSIFDHENELELLERRYAIPVFAPEKVTVMPFEFESVGVHTTTLTL